MTETTYYTPEISEFHVGFQYEHYSEVCGCWLKCWYDTMYDQRGKDKLDELHMIGERVKYLDQQDIESCGFTFYHKNDKSYWGGIAFIYVKGNTIGNLFLYHLPDKNKIVVRQELEQGENQVFEGIIKNISELKMVLKQTQ